MSSSENGQVIERLASAIDNIRSQLSQVIVGQEEVVEQLLISLFSRGHCMLEGVPGLARRCSSAPWPAV